MKKIIMNQLSERSNCSITQAINRNPQSSKLNKKNCTIDFLYYIYIN